MAVKGSMQFYHIIRPKKKKKKSQAHTLISSDNQELVTEKESEVLTSGGWGAADGIVY